MALPIEEMKPYPNEHACRLHDPGGYDRLRRNNCAEKHEGKCIDVIYGIKENKSEIQALRYPKDVWEAGAARTHCSGRGGSFEAASEKEDSQEGPKGGRMGTVEIERKVVQLKGLKLEDSGAFKALFARFDDEDKQGDITLPGAFGKRQNVIISAYGHGSWTGALPVGKGFIHDDEEAGGGVVEGQFFLNTQAGKETYTIVKELGELQEWSYALPEIDYEMRTIDNHTVRVLKRITVNEVSPVLMGAGNGTRTLAIKGGEAVALTFAERMVKATLENEDIAERLRGRRGFRASDSRHPSGNPSASDVEGVKVWLESLERITRALRDTIERYKAFDKVMKDFEAMTKGD